MRQLIDGIIARHPVKAGAFIVTLYGDVVVPRGGTLWIGNVIETCAAVGISETHVRTAVSRLVSRKRLVGTRRGRRSFYKLDDAAHDEFERASAIIYGRRLNAPSADWTIVALDAVEDKASAGSELARAGFVRLSPAMMASAGDLPDCERVRSDLIVFRAQLMPGQAKALRAFVAEHWPLQEMQADFAAFIKTFAGLVRTAEGDRGQGSLLARLLLVHEFRRLALRDPNLPADALPPDWPGYKARRLFSDLYKALTPAAEGFIAANFVDERGALAAQTPVTRGRLETLQEMWKN